MTDVVEAEGMRALVAGWLWATLAMGLAGEDSPLTQPVQVSIADWRLGDAKVSLASGIELLVTVRVASP